MMWKVKCHKLRASRFCEEFGRQWSFSIENPKSSLTRFVGFLLIKFFSQRPSFPFQAEILFFISQRQSFMLITRVERMRKKKKEKKIWKKQIWLRGKSRTEVKIIDEEIISSRQHSENFLLERRRRDLDRRVWDVRKLFDKKFESFISWKH